MVRFFAVYQAKCSFVRSVRLGMFRGTFQQYHDTESWYGIQYLDDGRERVFEHSGVSFLEPHPQGGMKTF